MCHQLQLPAHSNRTATKDGKLITQLLLPPTIRRLRSAKCNHQSPKQEHGYRRSVGRQLVPTHVQRHQASFFLFAKCFVLFFGEMRECSENPTAILSGGRNSPFPIFVQRDYKIENKQFTIPFIGKHDHFERRYLRAVPESRQTDFTIVISEPDSPTGQILEWSTFLTVRKCSL
ncbi:hypothetical protein GQ42DRAFT_90770 [Ramicandelaber brevisporus]|nr:hypothetical protein GQ42DRAFT_90770 [Ramicandelaber brevisporus]